MVLYVSYISTTPLPLTLWMSTKNKQWQWAWVKLHVGVLRWDGNPSLAWWNVSPPPLRENGVSLPFPSSLMLNYSWWQTCTASQTRPKLYYLQSAPTSSRDNTQLTTTFTGHWSHDIYPLFLPRSAQKKTFTISKSINISASSDPNLHLQSVSSSSSMKNKEDINKSKQNTAVSR